MKKAASIVISVALLLVLVLAIAPKDVSASSGDIGSGEWILPSSSASFTAVNVDQAALTAPTWLQQLSEGIKIKSADKICYPFRGGSFKWVPQIMKLTDSKWSNIKTTQEKINGEEDILFACAQAPAAGTYTLFGYYSGQNAQTSQAGKLFTVGSWAMTVEDLRFGDLYANQVNWQGYPTAAYLAWGVKMCWDSECHEYPDDYISISESGFPYPQNYDVTIISGLTHSFTTSTEYDTCQMFPFVELLDSSYNVLDVIYYDNAYSDQCVS